MANYTIDQTATPPQRAAHAKVLVASTVDTVTFVNERADSVTVLSDGTADIYFTVNGDTPTVAGANTFRCSANNPLRTVQGDSSPTTVKLISAGTPTYSVSRTS